MKIFDKISINQPKKSVFDLSHERKFSMNMGDLVPVLVQEVIPGDKFRLNMEQLVRLQPMVAPMMHRVNVFTHFFFVPNRIIWNDWEKFITGGDKGEDAPVFPMFKNTSAMSSTHRSIFGYGSLADYMGIPVNRILSVADGQQVSYDFSQLPFRAYQMIYNEYYRDQNLQAPIEFSKTSGTTAFLPVHSQLRKRAWEKDYFTSALPYAQKGEQLTMPIQGDAPVTAYNPSASQDYPVTVGTMETSPNHNIHTLGAVGEPLKADLDNATGSTINELRQAFQIQKWLERNARGGTRYIEQILSHFGVRSSDARLQRPEYLGGGKTPITVSEVLQMSSSDETSPQGTMAGHGVSAGASHQFSRYFEEHGFIIGIMSVIPRTSYFQGMPRIYSKTDRFEYFWPEFAHLGEQSVRREELFYDPQDPTGSTNKFTFGYQPRYTEYRYVPDTVHGDFASSLKFWHMARQFATPPELNSAFVQCEGEALHRPFAVSTATVPKLLVQTYANIKAIRPIPKYGNPGGI